jgi:hypothetical protein
MTWDQEGNVKIKPSSELPSHVTAAVSKIASMQTKHGTTVSVEMHPKVQPLNLLGQHFSLWDSEKKQQEKAATNTFLELLARIKSGKFDDFVEKMQPSLLNPPPGIVIAREVDLIPPHQDKAKNEL